MKIQSLENTPFEVILQCFFDAFADYFVDVRMPVEFWHSRWKADRVNFSHSYGVFDDDNLVGFILNGIGYRDGKKTAFNAGTGVIPKYRGQRLVKKMYEAFLPELKSIGIENCALEVITENKKAVKAYQSVGMQITRHYICYNGPFQISDFDQEVIVKKVETPSWDTYADFQREGYSWGNSRTSVELYDSFEAYEMWSKSQLKGYFLIDPEKSTLAQFEVKNNDWETWGKPLFRKVSEISSTIKINNQDNKNKARIRFLNQINLPVTIEQFEMEMVV
ncbi:MAG: GNAT family N-acetyltransferase [Bacteroidetes bacterium]|nr:MAG: GNAT family N-acetyltransferase [Bacteroidota bacterium]